MGLVPKIQQLRYHRRILLGPYQLSFQLVMVMVYWIQQAGHAHQEESLAVILSVSTVVAPLIGDRHLVSVELEHLVSSELTMSPLRDGIHQDFATVLPCLPTVAMSC